MFDARRLKQTLMDEPQRYTPFFHGAATTDDNAVSLGAWKVLAGSAVGFAMDGFDLQILIFMLRAIAPALGLGPARAASLATGTLVGAMLGGIGFGVLADRLGRVRVLTWTIMLFALFTGLCALARGYWDLLLYRTVTGMGLGGEFGIGMALVAEAWPAGKRARVSSYLGLGLQAGILAAALLTPVLLPKVGWRGMFALGIFPAAVAFVIRGRLREPELFVASRAAAPARPSLRLLFADAATTRISLGMAILCTVQNFGYYGMMVWMPNYLAGRFGFGLTQSATWTAVTILGMMGGISLFGHVADRIGRRPAFLVWMLGAALMVVVYARLSDATALLVVGAIMGFFVNGMLGGYGALISELYPTVARATAQNVLFNTGRAVGGFGPIVVGTIAGRWGFPWATALLALLYGIDVLALWLLIPERRGSALT